MFAFRNIASAWRLLAGGGVVWLGLGCSGGSAPPDSTAGTTGLGQGSTPGECSAGFVDAGDGTCIDVDECLDAGAAGCDPLVMCINYDGGFVCGPCPSGYAGDGEAGCTDVDECATDNGGCGDPARFSCTNREGQVPVCSDVDECATANGGCGDATFYTCTNQVGAAPLCADIDECATNNGGCGDATFYTCTNQAGAAPLCADIDECATNNGGCGDVTFFVCTNQDGAVPTCSDVDECATNNGGCDALVTCTNQVGAAPVCGACPSGYNDVNSNGTSCVDIDECATNNGGCDAAAVCTNSVGSFSCACPSGYTDPGGNGLVCNDINECLTANGGCDTGESCVNTMGSSQCGPCLAGYVGPGNGSGCSLSVMQLAGGDVHICGLLGDGRVMCWGSNSDGVLGSGDLTSVRYPARFVAGITTGVEIAAGTRNVCVRLSNGSIQCWGRHNVGQVGDGTAIPGADVLSPTGVSGIGGGGPLAISLAGKTDHFCAALDDGTTRCWGESANGRLGNNDGSTDQPSPVTVQAWPTTCTYFNGQQLSCTTDFGGVLADLMDARQVAVGSAHGCVLGSEVTIDGQLTTDPDLVRCWGLNSSRQFGTNNTTSRLAAGEPTQVLPNVLANTEVTTLASGELHNCILRSDNTVYCWGESGNGQTGTGGTTDVGLAEQVATNVQQIQLGLRHTCVRLTSGAIQCWGRNNYGQLGGGTVNTPTQSESASAVLNISTASFLSGTHDTNCVALQVGDLQCWGRNRYFQVGQGTASSDNTNVATPLTVGSMTSSAEVAGGLLHTCVRRSNGTIRCWGRNNPGQLGYVPFSNIPTADRWAPTQIPTITTATKVVAGYNHTCALLQDQTVQCWGNGDTSGEIGDGNNMDRTVPTSVVGLAGNVIDIAAGFRHTCAVIQGGTVQCWGENANSQLGDPGSSTDSNMPATVLNVSSATRVTAGESHACALLNDGTVSCWGDSTYGQSGSIGTPQGATVIFGLFNVTEVQAIGDTTCAIVAQSPLTAGVYCWGRNNQGQLGRGSLTPTSTNVPARITTLGTTQTLATGGGGLPVQHVCAVLADGTMECWGLNNNGQLGDGTTTTPVTAPQAVPALTNVVGGATGAIHTCAVHSDGTTSCWGDNAGGQVGNGMNVDVLSPFTLPSLFQ